MMERISLRTAPAGPFIEPRRPLPLVFRLAAWLTRRKTGLDLRVPQILAWYPKTALGSAVLEALVAHGKGDLDPRILKLVRMATSFAVSCPFCIDMNSHKHAEHGITEEEVRALRHQALRCPSFSERERLAVEYARAASAAPLVFPSELVERLKSTFTAREMVILASTAAQVNYWARLLQALGMPPAGFSEQCRVPTPTTARPTGDEDREGRPATVSDDGRPPADQKV